MTRPGLAVAPAIDRGDDMLNTKFKGKHKEQAAPYFTQHHRPPVRRATADSDIEEIVTPDAERKNRADGRWAMRLAFSARARTPRPLPQFDPGRLDPGRLDSGSPARLRPAPRFREQAIPRRGPFLRGRVISGLRRLATYPDGLSSR